jgi:phosphopantothenate---cysteine ligase (CTP)
MNCIVTAGPTYEPLDQVRRLTNMSTGRLGSLLANFLVERGHQVTLLYGHYSTFHGEQRAQVLEKFTTTADLQDRLKAFSSQPVGAVFHAAAVSDFGFGKVYEKLSDGTEREIVAGKIPTRAGRLSAELIPTPKIIAGLRAWFPTASLIGWKYEVDGSRSDVLLKAEHQIVENRTDGCVANGAAYGFGFGLVHGPGKHEHFSDVPELFRALEAAALKSQQR